MSVNIKESSCKCSFVFKNVSGRLERLHGSSLQGRGKDIALSSFFHLFFLSKET